MDAHKVVRYIVYSFEILILFVIQQTPELAPPIFGARPVLILPALLTVSMFEKEGAAMGFGVFTGILMGFGMGAPVGYHALVLCVMCFFLSLFCQYVFQINMLTAIFAGMWCIAIVFTLDWLFLYLMPGLSMPRYALINAYLPRFLYSLIPFPLFFIMNRGLSRVIQVQE